MISVIVYQLQFTFQAAEMEHVDAVVKEITAFLIMGVNYGR